MSIYTVEYYRHDKKVTESKPVQADTMTKAVQRLIDTANYHNTKISNISVTVKGSKGVQRFCDVCLKTEAMFGCKDKKMKCKECMVC
jgi:hypothetical protein